MSKLGLEREDRTAEGIYPRTSVTIYRCLVLGSHEVWFGRGWVEARNILTIGIEPIMRGEIPVEDGLHNSAEEMRRRLNKG